MEKWLGRKVSSRPCSAKHFPAQICKPPRAAFALQNGPFHATPSRVWASKMSLVDAFDIETPLHRNGACLQSCCPAAGNTLRAVPSERLGRQRTSISSVVEHVIEVFVPDVINHALHYFKGKHAWGRGAITVYICTNTEPQQPSQTALIHAPLYIWHI